MPHVNRAPAASVRLGTAQGRWVVAAAVLGSGIAFLDGTLVNAALPAIGHDLDADIGGLQWVVTGYLLTLGSLLVLGGSLGDRYGRRRVFEIGVTGFGVASVLCGLAPSTELLVVARALQGIAGALLVPGSLAIITASFCEEDRGAAIGAWSGLGAISTAVGPFAGGFMIDSISWRAAFFVNVPLVVATVVMTRRHVPETVGRSGATLDVAGATTLTLGLAGVVYALIEGPGHGWSAVPGAALGVGLALLVAFFVVERTVAGPMLPLEVFRSRQFSGANATTFAVYGALGVVFFLLVVHLQEELGYSALEAGAAALPGTALLILFSSRMGRIAQRIGPRVPMTLGPLVIAASFVMMGGIEPGRGYVGSVLPAVVLFGAGLTITVAPLTAAVLAAVGEERAGIASAINNAVARIAGLLAVAVLPPLVGFVPGTAGATDAFADGMLVSAGLTALGAALAWATIRTAAPVRALRRSEPQPACADPAVGIEAVAGD
jgi:EmrB/QacA subfamily drug resistance transporter